MKPIGFWIVLIVLAGVRVFASFKWGFVIFTDDAFISFRYARNLLDGNGLVFNHGERVEGYPNFLWIMLLAAGMSAGFDPVDVSEWLGLMACLASLVIVVLVSGRFHPGLIKPAVCGVFLIADRDFLRWRTGGLVTSLFTLLVLTSVTTAISVLPSMCFRRSRSCIAHIFCGV